MKRLLFLLTAIACLSTMGSAMKVAYEIGPKPDFMNKSAYEIGPRPDFQPDRTA